MSNKTLPGCILLFTRLWYDAMKTTKTRTTHICLLKKLLKHRLYVICKYISPKTQVLTCIVETRGHEFGTTFSPVARIKMLVRPRYRSLCALLKHGAWIWCCVQSVAKDTHACLSEDTGHCARCWNKGHELAIAFSPLQKIHVVACIVEKACCMWEQLHYASHTHWPIFGPKIQITAQRMEDHLREPFMKPLVISTISIARSHLRSTWVQRTSFATGHSSYPR